MKKGMGEKTIHVESKVTRPFSNPKSTDKFSISIQGKTILEGNAVFTIVTKKGVEIHSEIFPSKYLLNRHDIAGMNNGELEELIKKEIKEFFTPNKFLKPAINSEDTFDSDYSKEEIWNEVKHNSKSIGFSYHYAEISDLRLAYSNKYRISLIYFSCC
jgi:hypothetical protein